MGSENPKWSEKMNITYEEYFGRSYSIPHPGIFRLVREMKAEFGREKAFEILDRAARGLTVEGIKRSVEAVPLHSFQEFVEGRRNKGPIALHGTSEEVLEETDEKQTFNMTGCLWAKAWREMGGADVGYVWNCRQDFPLVRAMHPSLRLKRSKTLMEGADCCDFTYYWEEE